MRSKVENQLFAPPKIPPFLLGLAMLFYLKRTITSVKDDGSLPCPAYLRGESFKKEVPKTSGEGAHQLASYHTMIHIQASHEPFMNIILYMFASLSPPPSPSCVAKASEEIT